MSTALGGQAPFALARCRAQALPSQGPALKGLQAGCRHNVAYLRLQDHREAEPAPGRWCDHHQSTGRLQRRVR